MPTATETKTEKLTNRMIRDLRDDAGAAGDLVTVFACDVALGREEPCDDADAFEERFGGGGFAAYERETIMSIDSVDAARENVAECISNARAARDDREYVAVVP